MAKSYFTKDLIEAGVDEAGRGCFAGPVCAAAVIFDKKYSNPELNDSKLLDVIRRNTLREEIEKSAMAFSVIFIDNTVIDEINILNASFEAMNQAVNKLPIRPQLLLIDGNRFHNKTGIPHECIIKGDQLYQSISAASILAKTYRDEYMCKIHEEFPQYRWNINKGYATVQHRAAIAFHGVTRYHRRSFNLNEQLRLFR